MGHIKKRRFAAVFGAALMASAGMGVAMAEGGLSANIALSNTVFTLKVKDMGGDGFHLFVDNEKMQNGDQGVSRLRIQSAAVNDLCMSAPINVPGLGAKKFQLIVPGDNFKADNLLIGAQSLSGALALEKPQIGVDASVQEKNAQPGAWGLAATRVTVTNQLIKATSISADKLSAAGARISIQDGDGGEC